MTESDRKDFRTLLTELLEMCERYETKVATAALFQAFMTVIVCAAPTLEEAKHTLKGALERADREIESAWAYREKVQEKDRSKH